MGFNTTVIVMNDMLSTIEKDEMFGPKLADAVRTSVIERPVYVDRATQAAVVVATHSSHAMLPVLVGRNTGIPSSGVVDWNATTEEMELELLKKLALKHGYSLRRRPR